MLNFNKKSNNYDLTIDYKLNNANIYFWNKVDQLEKLNYTYNSYDELNNKFIALLNNEEYDFELIINNISYANLDRNFNHLLIIKRNNIYIYFNILISKLNFIKDFFICKNSFKTNYELPTYLNLDNLKFDQNYIKLHYYNHIFNYIKNKHSITIKEILCLNNIYHDDNYEIELQSYVDCFIDNEETIIGDDNQMYKIYKWELCGTLQEIIFEYLQNI